MNKRYLLTMMVTTLCSMASLSAHAAQSQINHLTCFGSNLEALEIVRENGTFKASLAWNYAAGDAIDEGTYFVHPTSSKDGSMVFLDGSAVSNSKIVLTLMTSGNGSSLYGHIIAQTPETSYILDTDVYCTVSREMSLSYNAACADPNSDAGIVAWDSGQCGPYGGGSN